MSSQTCTCPHCKNKHLIEEEKCDISDQALAKWRDDATRKIKFQIDTIKS